MMIYCHVDASNAGDGNREDNGTISDNANFDENITIDDENWLSNECKDDEFESLNGDSEDEEVKRFPKFNKVTNMV